LPAPTIHREMTTTSGYARERSVAATFRGLLEQWARLPASQRPDSLLFNDDIVLRAVAPLLTASPFFQGGNIKIATMANEDVRFCYGFKVLRHEISPLQIAKNAYRLLAARLDGRPPEKEATLFEGKLTFED